MSARPPLEPGEEIAPGYRVVDHLSRGRRLDVYDIWSAERASRCVGKALRPDRADEDGPRQWLREEGRLLERFTHPHIVRAYETLAEPPMVVLETLPGETLGVIVDEGRARISAVELAHLGTHLASALRYMHGQGILHLDLKPSNVIASGQLAKLIDLSLAQPPGPAPPGVGTWNYMAPEQARGGELSAAADVWGLGVVLYEMATGKPAFDDPGHAGPDTSEDDSSGPPADRYPQLEGEPEPLAESRPDLDPGLAALLESCLSPEPGPRPALDAILAELESLTAA